MTERHDSVILHFVVRVFMVPFIFVFGIYVLIHGEASPGGGFQAGAIVASSIVLGRLTLGNDHSEYRFPTRLLIWLSSLGLGIYLVTGIIPRLFGGNYLDYNVLAHDPVHGQHLGILIIEFGVGLTVASVMISIFYYFAGRGR